MPSSTARLPARFKSLAGVPEVGDDRLPAHRTTRGARGIPRVCFEWLPSRRFHVASASPDRLKAPAAEESTVRLPDGWLSAVRSCLGRRLVPRLLSGTVAHLRPAATASPDKRCCLGSSPLPSTSARAVWIGGRDISTACRLHAPPPRACTVNTRWRGDLFKPPQRSGSSHVPQQRSLGGKSKMKRCGFYEVAQCC